MPPSLQTPIFALILIIISSISSSAILLSLPAVAAANVQPTTHVGGNGNAPTQGHGKMIAEFLSAHNEVRAKYGEPLLRWNHTLERYAQQWAALRASDCKLVHAPNNQYGENLFWGKYRHWKPREVVKQWADEVAFYNSKNYQCAEGQQCGHYTQIVWRSSAWLGCAKQICLNGEIFVVCEYFPAGNYLDTPDPFTAKTSYSGEENNIPQSSDIPNVTSTGATSASTTTKTESSSSLQSTTITSSTKGTAQSMATQKN